MGTLFQVNDLHVTYRRPGEKPLEAVKGVSFTLAEGETLGIVGESGSRTQSMPACRGSRCAATTMRTTASIPAGARRIRAAGAMCLPEIWC